jgi:hypothetical protein
MYREPLSRIVIGSGNKFLEFNNVNRVEIIESVKELGNKATITLPRNYRKFENKSILELIKSGDPVKIFLGYDGELREEFNGYLQFPESNAPLIIHVDDEFYPLKRNNFKKTFPDGTTLREILEYVASGYEIICPDVTLSSFQIPNISTYQVLNTLKDQYGFYTRLNGNVLTCMWPYEIEGDIHTYTFYTPTVKKNDLKYQRTEDVKIKIRAIANQRTGKKLTFNYPPGPDNNEVSIRTLNFGPITQKQLEQVAKKEYERIAFDGYRGNITGFGTPRTHAGDTLKIVDRYEPDREGNYLIDSVKIIYDLNQGFERINTLSFKV